MAEYNMIDGIELVRWKFKAPFKVLIVSWTTNCPWDERADGSTSDIVYIIGQFLYNMRPLNIDLIFEYSNYAL